MKRIFIIVAVVCEILAAAGLGEVGIGSIHLSLVAAGLAFYLASLL